MMTKKTRLRLLPALMILLLCATVRGAAFSEGSPRAATVMVYMCGSNLESGFGSASSDIGEMLEASRDAKDISVLVMTGGSQTGPGSGYFRSDTTSIYEIRTGRIRNVWESPKAMSMGDAETLQTLIRYAQENRPAERYALILWNHGGGPLEGVCYDELFSMDSLSLEELVQALEEARLPGKLSWIGFDACLMGSAEVAYAVSPYAEYMIASQEKEPAAGWDYHFLKEAGKDRDGAETGRRIVDGYAEALKEDPNPLTLSCVDLARLRQAMPAMDAFFANVGSDVRPDNYSELSILRLDSVGFGKAVRGTESHSYDLVDLQDLVAKLGKNGNNDRLLSLLQDSVVYSRSTIPGATGLSVYHPYSNKGDYIKKWSGNYAGLAFSGKYQDYISGFGKILTSDVLADWSGLKPETEGTASSRGRIALQLTEMQRKTFAKGQVLILAAYDDRNGIYSIAGTRSDKSETLYAPVSVSYADMDPEGKLTAEISSRTLYATDENGKPICGPLTYELSDDGETCYIQGFYEDRSGREDAAKPLSALYSFRMESGGGPLEKTGVMGYDYASGTFTPRVPVEESGYTVLTFRTLSRKMPEGAERLPGFEEWEEGEMIQYHSVELPRNWQLRFFDTQMSAVQLYVVFQITDNQQNRHSSQPVPVVNPNLESVQVQPRVIDEEDYRLRFFVIRDTSPLDPGINLAVEITNLSKKEKYFHVSYPVINGSQSVIPQRGMDFISVTGLQPRKTCTVAVHLDGVFLTNLTSIEEISMEVNYKEISFSVSRCSLEGIADIRDQILAETTRNGLTWELVGLERAGSYGYEAVIRLTNHKKTDKTVTALCAAEDLLVGGDTDGGAIDLTIPAESMGYLSVSIPDRCRLEETFHLEGQALRYTLTAENQFARYGVSAIRSLRIIPTDYNKSVNYADLILDTPVPAAAGEAPEPPRGKRLLTGPVEAYVERAGLADNGVGVRVVFVNHTEQNVRIETEAVFNDKYVTKVWDMHKYKYIVPAMGKTVCCIGYSCLDLLMDEVKIEKAGLKFYINQIETTTAMMSFTPNDAKGFYLPETAYEIVPGSYEPEKYRFLSEPVTTDDGFIMQVEGAFTRYSDSVREENPEGNLPLYLRLTVKATNLTDKTLDFRNPSPVINGERQAHVIFSNVLAGYTRADAGETLELSEYIPLKELRGITEIHEISLRFGLWEELAFPVGPLDASGLIPSGHDCIAEGGNAQATVQLLSFSEDEKGRLTLGMRLYNNGLWKTGGLVMILLNGIEIDGGMTSLPSVSPGEYGEAEVKLENRIKVPASAVRYDWDKHRQEGERKPNPAIVPDVEYDVSSLVLEDHSLERRGVSEVSEIRIIGIGGSEIVLVPDEPIRLADIPVSHGEGSAEKPLSILYDYVFVGEDRVFLTLDLINRLDAEVRIVMESPKVNGEDCEFIIPQIKEYLRPNSRKATTLCIYRDQMKSLMREGDSVQDISLACTIETGGQTGTTQISLKLLREAPLGAETGALLNGSDLQTKVNNEALLLHEPVRTEAETVSPVLLIPALDKSRAEAFAEGRATVYIQKEEAHRELTDDGGDGRYEYYPERHSVCTVDIVKDEQGRIVSKYSGLACVNTQGQVLQHYEYSDLNGEYDSVWQALPREEGVSHVISCLFADAYLDREKYWKYRADGGEKPGTDGRLFVLNLIETRDGHSSVIDTSQAVYSNDMSSRLEFEEQECGRMYCTAVQEIIVVKPDQPGFVKKEDRQIVRLGDLRYVPAEALDGTLMVRYQITYLDGRTEDFYEAYPQEGR